MMNFRKLFRLLYFPFWATLFLGYALAQTPQAQKPAGGPTSLPLSPPAKLSDSDRAVIAEGINKLLAARMELDETELGKRIKALQQELQKNLAEAGTRLGQGCRVEILPDMALKPVCPEKAEKKASGN